MDRFADDRCIQPLRRLLSDPVPRFRRMALHSLSCDACKLEPLARNADFDALAIEQAFNDPSIRVRRHVVVELRGRRDAAHATAALGRIQAEGTDERVHRSRARMKEE